MVALKMNEDNQNMLSSSSESRTSEDEGSSSSFDDDEYDDDDTSSASFSDDDNASSHFSKDDGNSSSFREDDESATSSQYSMEQEEDNQTSILEKTSFQHGPGGAWCFLISCLVTLVTAILLSHDNNYPALLRSLWRRTDNVDDTDLLLGPMPDIGKPIIYHFNLPTFPELMLNENNSKDHVKKDDEMVNDSCTSTQYWSDCSPPKYHQLPPMITPKMHQEYNLHGVIAIRGLISPELLHQLDLAADTLIGFGREEKSTTTTTTTRKTKRKKSGSGGGQFHTVKIGAVYLDPPSSKPPTGNQSKVSSSREYDNHRRTANRIHKDDEFNKERDGNHDNDYPGTTMTTMSAFRNVALHSAIPQIAAELMGMKRRDDDDSSAVVKDDNSSKNKNTETLRMLRDVFLAKDEGEYICGWHVDDYGFWPANPSSPGINAWIALDDMPLSNGGGFALAIASHIAPWRFHAYNATGSTHTYPPNGYRNVEDLFANRTGQGTCNIQTAAPSIYHRMEDTKRIYDIQRGDVIFHTRWLFHRTVSFERDYVNRIRHEQQQQQQEEEKENQEMLHHSRVNGDKDVREQEQRDKLLIYRRYSVRYAPGSAEVPRGYGTEPSVLWDESNGGRTIDDVAAFDGPWYPRCWPCPSREEMNQMHELAWEKLPVAEARKKERLREMQPYLRQMSRRRTD